MAEDRCRDADRVKKSSAPNEANRQRAEADAAPNEAIG